jgi:uncharacterized protein (DUF1697 family)
VAECIALIRGINVGRAKRIAMEDLRGLLTHLGHENVRTVLNSGNVLFRSARPNPAKLSLAIEEAITAAFGFAASVAVTTATDLADIVRDNPLLHIAKDPAKHLVAFVARPRGLLPLRTLLKESWAPDALAIGPLAAYLWCPSGVLDSKLAQAFARRTGETVTTRNWATVLKLLAATNAGS